MDTRMKRFLVAVLMMSSVLGGCRSEAMRTPAHQSPPATSHPATATFDRLEASGDPELFQVLLQQKSPDSIAATLDWVQPRALAGGDPRYLYAYSYNLWRLRVRDSAFAMWLAAGLHAAVDASKCRDPSAPGANIAPWERLMHPVAVSYEAERPEDRRRYLELAAMIEAKNKARGPNAWICAGGMDYYLKYFERHPREEGAIVDDERYIGKVRRLPDDPDIKPEFTSGEEWESARLAAVQTFTESRR